MEKTCLLGNGNLFGTYSKIRLCSNLFLSLEQNTDKKNIILMSTRCLQSAALSSSVNELSRPQEHYLVVLALLKVCVGSAGFLVDKCAEMAEGRSQGRCTGERESLAAVGKDVMI